MLSIRLIRRRIRAARNISQITRAMQMVAASKLRRAQEKAVGGKPYAQKIYETVSELISKIKTVEDFPILRQKTKGVKILVVLVSTNKGLCGGLNTNLFRSVNSWFPLEQPTDFITFGRKAELLILRTGRNLIADFSSAPFLESVGAAVNIIVSGFSKEEYREVYLAYNDFVSILKQSPTKKMILPIGVLKLEGTGADLTDYLIEPKVVDVLRALLPYYLEVQVRAAILEATASEHAARTIAMKAATDNAHQLMEELTLAYNKARQQQITYEIADIVTAREAMVS